MKPPPFEYHAPRCLQEAIETRARLENAKFLAGGQSLMPMLNMRYVQPDHVIDLNHIEDLAYVREEGNIVAIGSMTRQRDIELSSLIQCRLPILSEALRFVGHVQTRNRGTIGGSLCHLDPSAELVAIASVSDAEVVVMGPKGQRIIPMSAFPAFYMTPAIDGDEVVTEVRFQPWPSGHGFAFEEVARRHGDFGLATVAVLLEWDESGEVARAAIAVGGLSSAPVRVRQAEETVLSTRLNADVIAAAAAHCRDIEAINDVHASSNYRQHVAGVLASRALIAAAARFAPAMARGLQ